MYSSSRVSLIGRGAEVDTRGLDLERGTLCSQELERDLVFAQLTLDEPPPRPLWHPNT